jgi:hypothetical protein
METADLIEGVSFDQQMLLLSAVVPTPLATLDSGRPCPGAMVNDHDPALLLQEI